ncbi:MAG: hypothetical protein QJR00_07275 [Bacillota bacterium]|nr:hypothetical protein [Bacillota bacterium]
MDTFNLLAGKISDETMPGSNDPLDEKGEPVEQVAQDFLRKEGLIP